MHDWKWDDLRVFLAAFRAGSLTQAAHRLGTEQSTVSRRIAALEGALGPLFTRSREGLRPTALAASMVPHAEQAEAAFGRVSALAAGEAESVEGTVRVAITDEMARTLLLPELPSLLAAHPGLRVEVVGGHGTVDLTRREADIALRFVRPARGDLMFSRVGQMPMAVLARRDLRLPEAMEDWPWIELDPVLGDMVERRWHAAHVGRPGRLSVSSYASQIEAVRCGLGVAILAPALSRLYPELRVVDPGLPLPEPMPVYLVTHRILRPLPRIEVLWETLARVAQQLDP